MPRNAAAGPALPVAARRRRVDADDDLAQAGGDRGRRVLDVQLEARAADHRPVEEPRAHAEVLGQAGGHAAVRDAVDVGDRRARRRRAPRGSSRPRARARAWSSTPVGDTASATPTMAAWPRNVRSVTRDLPVRRAAHFLHRECKKPRRRSSSPCPGRAEGSASSPTPRWVPLVPWRRRRSGGSDAFCSRHVAKPARASYG